jgi:hypothetical protein
MDIDAERTGHVDMNLGQVAGPRIDIAPFPRKGVDARDRRA